MHYAIVIDINTAHPFMVDTVFPDMDAAYAYAITYLDGRRAYRFIEVDLSADWRK